ncbi:MAG: DNA mismatch repair endonuclease MutL [Treponema sp.]|nr:DNA mismatch repair endonuclease MutL [Treponema sp.]
MKIQVLPPEEARRIAAGEVIDRPAALIRELLDNAIDAGASAIDVSIEGGGSKKVEVADDGSGMGREDLETCWLAHATSKIRSLDDLNTAETLGFRGEALAAIAAVAQLEIISNTGAVESWRLNVGPGLGNPPQITAAGRTKGSTIRAINVYDTIPARKRFLKRDGSEAALCRQVFIEKALAFPWINFRFTQDGRLKDFFPAAVSKKERFAAALLETGTGQLLHEIHVSGDGFSADVVIGGPELFRTDRRYLYIFANGRRIQDYSLVTAMEYGVQGWFPNGTHPLGAVYVDIDPSLADFNIHPAKREARFRDPGAIHHAVTSGLRDFCRRLGLKTAAQTEPHSTNQLAMAALSDTTDFFTTNHTNQHERRQDSGDQVRRDVFAQTYTAERAPVYGDIRYAGSIFGLFILAEQGDKLFIIDQHAAHERILYNRFLAAPIPRQELLIPIYFNTESIKDDQFLEAKQKELAALAIVLERDGNVSEGDDGSKGDTGWHITALPEGWRLGDAETVQEILKLRNATENIAERWAATLCCHQAVRDGDYLDEIQALALATEALALPDPRCPHGRPVWTELSREALCKAVRRT